MAKQPLVAKQLESIIKSNETGRYAVGYGLYLNISKDKTLSWLYRYKLAGKSRWMGLGVFNRENTLAKMHREAERLKSLVRQGVDPIEQRKSLTAGLKATNKLSKMTFKVCAKIYIDKQRPKWKSAKTPNQWLSSLTDYAYPIIGNLPVQDIEVHHITKILDPIWYTKTETASRVRGRIENILSYAKVVLKCRKGENPAVLRGNLDMVYPPKSKVTKVIHHAAMNYKELPQFMQRLNDETCLAAKALMLTILTAPRTCEVIAIKTSEIKDGIWEIPEERMKKDIEHKIPLSIQALDLLDELTPINDYLFPSPTKKTSEGAVCHISTGAMYELLKRMNVKGATVHGFRSTFRDWTADETNYDGEVANKSLAHKLKDETEAAYNRANLLEKRKKLMQDWANYCLPLRKEEKVIPIRA